MDKINRVRTDMNGFEWVDDHINGEWTIKQGYIEYFKSNVMQGSENNGPYDGWFRIPNWKEVLSMRNELRDPNSLLCKHLTGDRNKMLEGLKIVTLEEYIEEFHPNVVAK